MLEKWFLNGLKRIMKHNDYNDDILTVAKCTPQNRWTPCDLVLREELNNGSGSAWGFLGITPKTNQKYYNYIKQHKEEIIKADMVNEKAWNNSGFTLWNNYDF